MSKVLNEIYKFAKNIHILPKYILKTGVMFYCSFSIAAGIMMLFPISAGDMGVLYWSENLLSLSSRVIMLCILLALISDLFLHEKEENSK